MKKVILAVIAAILLEASSFASPERITRTVTDCAGAKAEIPAKVSRIISTNNAFCAFMTAMGMSDRLIGAHGSFIRHSWTPIFFGNTGRLMIFGYEPAPEAVYMADADIVVLNSRLYAEKLRSAGIPAVYFGYSNIKEMYSALDFMAEILGDEAASYVAKWKNLMDKTIETVAADVSSIPHEKRKSVYFVNASANKGIYGTSGGGSFVEYWMNTIGAGLVTSQYENLTLVNPEVILSLNPDAVIISGYLAHQYKNIILSDPLWEDITAVRNNEIHIMPTGLTGYEKFAVDIPMLMRISLSRLYPEYHKFGGISELREFYAEYYGLNFSDDLLSNMLECLNPDGTMMR